MKNKLSPSELMDKFLNSDPNYINSILDEFDNLIGEGPSVTEYFELFENEFNLFNQMFSNQVFTSNFANDIEYSSLETNLSLKLPLGKTNSIASINISDPPKEAIRYSKNITFATAA
jgi:hypothetical protein